MMPIVHYIDAELGWLPNSVAKFSVTGLFD
jgi:hypothetical protein